MFLKKWLLCGVMLLTVTVAGIIVGCTDNEEPKDPFGPDGGQSQRAADSLMLAKIIDSMITADRIRNIEITDSIRIADSIKLAIILDSTSRADSIAYRRMLDSLRFVNMLIAEQNRIADSVRRAEYAIWVADSMENERLMDSARAAGDLAKSDSIEAAAKAQDSIQQEGQKIFTTDSLADIITKNNERVASFPEQARNIIGAGYDITGLYASYQNRKPLILDFNRLAIDGRIMGGWVGNTYRSSTVEGRTISDYQTNLSKRLDANARIRVWWLWGRASFAAQVKASFGEDKIRSTEYAFITKSSIVTLYNYKLPDPADILVNYLSPDFLRDLETFSASDIVYKYGTHVILGADFGGRLDYNMSIQKIDQNTTTELNAYIDAKIAASIPFISGQLSGGFQTLEKFRNAFNEITERVSVMAYGGVMRDASAISSSGPSGDKWDNWVESVTPDNMTFSDYHTDGLRLISDFVRDPHKKSEINAYIENYMNDMGIVVTQEVRLSQNPIVFASERRLGGIKISTQNDEKMVTNNRPGSYLWSLSVDSVALTHPRDDGTYRRMELTVTYTIDENKGDNTIYRMTNVWQVDLSDRQVVSVHQDYISGIISGSYLHSQGGNWVAINEHSPLKNITMLEAKAGNKSGEVGHNFKAMVMVYERVSLENQNQGKRTVIGKRK
ncbi:MAG: MACPF domain-containing protein [Chitinispirillia bacterium]|nr:MACPF domain-containing protein [Chitinispirillia bacterium]